MNNSNNKPICSRLHSLIILCFFLGQTLLAPPAIVAQEPFTRQLESIGPLIEEAIEARKCPGAVVLIGHDGKVVYRRAFGNRTLVPQRKVMTADTIFDLASLTKVIATTTAIMQLVDAGKIRLEDRVSEYWPEFRENGKEDITIRELMTHYSGFRGDLTLKPEW